MGVCRQLLPVALLSLLVMGITVMKYSSLEPMDFLETVDYVQTNKCVHNVFAITEEVEKTKRCVTAMYHGQMSPNVKGALECFGTHGPKLMTSLSLLQLKSVWAKITEDDIVDFVIGVDDTTLQMEKCITTYLSLKDAAKEDQVVQCVNGLQERVSKIAWDIARCLEHPTPEQKLLEQIKHVGVLSYLLLYVVLFLTLLSSLRRIYARSEKPAIMLILVILILFVGFDFMCKESFVKQLLQIIASTNVLSCSYLRRIKVVDLDESIGRVHSKWRPISSKNKTVWRYPGEDVMLFCLIGSSFPTKKLRQEDIEVDWFHNGQKLKFTLRHNTIDRNITIHNNRATIVIALIVKHLTTEDFGSYSCDISQHLQPFATLHLDQSFPTEVHPILPLEINESIPPGAMLKVKFSHVLLPDTRDRESPKFYRRVNNIDMKWTLEPSLDNCNVWTIIQNFLYDMVNEDNGPLLSNETLGGIMSFCLSLEDFGRHEFVIQRPGSIAFERHAYPVSLNVKNAGNDKKFHPGGEIYSYAIGDFIEAASSIIDIFLTISLLFFRDGLDSVATFCFLWIFRQILRKIIPAVALRFLKQECRRQQIYIACSKHDRKWTDGNVVEFLESLGHETFLPARDCPPNQLEIEALAEGVVTCHKYVMVVSTHFLGEEQWRFERSLIVEELRRRQCCPDGEHPTCLLFVCLGAAEVPGPRVGGSVVHAPQARRRGGLRCQVRSWLEDAVFREEEWNTWYLLGVSALIAISQSRVFILVIFRALLLDSIASVMKWLSPET